MGKSTIVKPELIWPGKYQENGTCQELPRLPFRLRDRFPQQTVGEVREEPWRNKLIWGDNLLVMNALLDEFAGKVNLIYLDPPFATGADFMLTPRAANDTTKARKESPAIQEKAYRDTWGRDLSDYLSMLWQRLPLCRALLSDTGSIYLHIGWEMSGYVQMLMNEIFGETCLQNLIIYNYGKFHHSKERWKRDFDVILFYAKHPTARTFNHDAVLDAYQERTEIRFDKVDENGKRYKIVKGRRVYYQGGVTPSSVWRLSNLQMNAVESLGYPTQKTEELLSKIISASSNPGDLVADFFCGSGTTLAVAEKLGRRWIGCDQGRPAIHTTRKRLLDIADCRPFEVLDLGDGERRYWYEVSFATEGRSNSALASCAYQKFILNLYGARPVAGLTHLHGKKGRAMVCVCAVDATMRRAEIAAALDECAALNRPELHILGWEWEQSLDVARFAAARTKGVKVLFLQIPREVMDQRAVEKGEVRFIVLPSGEVL